MKHYNCPYCKKKIPLENDWGDLYLGISITRGFHGGEWLKYLCGQSFIKMFCQCIDTEPKSVDDLLEDV